MGCYHLGYNWQHLRKIFMERDKNRETWYNLSGDHKGRILIRTEVKILQIILYRMNHLFV
jgi:hypothetical protein